MMSNLNKLSIPKAIFENLFFQDGGQKQQALTGQFMYGLPEHLEEKANSEIEDSEYVQTKGTVVKAVGETHENGGIKTILDSGDKVLSDHLKVGSELAKKLSKGYEIKIKPTDTYAKVLDKYLKKIGHADATEEAEKYIKKLDEQKAKTKDEATLALNQEVLLQEIKEYGDKVNELEQPKLEMFSLLFKAQEDSKFKKENTNSFETGGEYTEEDQKQRLKDFYNQAVALGYEGALNLNGNLGEEAGKLQKFMVKKAPQAVLSYFKNSGQPMTAKGIDILKQKNKEAFTKAGISTTKPSSEYTPQEKAKLAEVAKVDDNFWLEQFQDNKWDWRYPMVSSEENLTPNIFENKITAPRLNLAVIPQSSSEQPQETPLTKEPSNEEPQYSAKQPLGFLAMPDRFLMSPNFRAPIKFTPTIYTGEKVEISPEQALTEINRGRVTTEKQLDQLPDAQRAATLASMDANNAQAVSKVIAETSRYNAQAQEKQSYEEADARTKQSMADAQASAQYQQLMGQELEQFDRELQKINNTRFEDQFQKWMYVNQMNRNNAFNRDVVFDGSRYYVTPEALKAQEERLKNVTKPIAKKGGKFNRKRFV